MTTSQSNGEVCPRRLSAFMGTVLLSLALLAAALLPATAQTTTAQNDPFAQAVQALDARKFSQKAGAIEALSVLGDERAILVLQAFADGRLYRRKADKLVVIGDRAGDMFNLTSPVTAETIGTAASGEIKKIVANNKLRGQIRGVLGQLALFSPNADDRLDAARNVIASPSEDALGLLKRARDRETVSKIRDTLETGIAVLELASDDRALRLAAVATLADRSDPDIKSALEQRLLESDGEPIEPDAEVRAALTEAVDDINDRLALFGLKRFPFLCKKQDYGNTVTLFGRFPGIFTAIRAADEQARACGSDTFTRISTCQAHNYSSQIRGQHSCRYDSRGSLIRHPCQSFSGP